MSRPVSTSFPKAILVRLTPDLHDAVKAKAARDERTMAQAIRHALRLYVAPEEGEPA